VSDRRIEILNRIGKLRSSEVILYVTGDRKGMETQIAGDIIYLFANHLDQLTSKEKLTLVLYTRGGLTLAAWNLVNMIREYVRYFEVIVLEKSLSAGTLISLGASKVVMSNQATLGPIDPSLTTSLNPIANGVNPPQPVPVSVEDVSGFMNYIKNEYKVRRGSNLKDIYLKLSSDVNPIVIGKVYRSKIQIQMLAKKLLRMHLKANKHFAIRRIVRFLCSDSGSHDYTINRTEASNLGLPIEKPSKELYFNIKELYDIVSDDLLLLTPFEPKKELGQNITKNYNCVRCLIESNFGGTHEFVTEGELRLLDKDGNTVTIDPKTQKYLTPPSQIKDIKTFEGWRKA
jgi:hypothetical protein